MVVTDPKQNGVMQPQSNRTALDGGRSESATAVTKDTQVKGGWNLRQLRSNLRLFSALIMLAFVLCHLTAHCFLLISLERAESVRK